MQEKYPRVLGTGIGRSTFDLDNYGYSTYHVMCFFPVLLGFAGVAQRRGELGSIKAELLPDIYWLRQKKDEITGGGLEKSREEKVQGRLFQVEDWLEILKWQMGKGG